MAIRIALWGGASLGNVGDQMLFDAVETGLGRRLPGAEFARYCPWAAGDGPVRPLWVSPSGRWPGTGSFDAIVIVGGVFAGPPFANVLMQAFTLGSAPAAFDPAVLTAWYGVGLDDTTRPPSQPQWHDYLRAAGRRLDFFTVRAPSAADRFRQAGAPVPRLVPDPAFGLPARPRAGQQPPAPGGRRPRIGVAVGEAVASSRLLGLFTDMRIVLRYVRESGFDRTTCLDAVEIAGREFGAGEIDPKRAFSTQLAAELAGLQRIGTVEFIAVDNMYDDAAASPARSARRRSGACRGRTPLPSARPSAATTWWWYPGFTAWSWPWRPACRSSRPTRTGTRTPGPARCISCSRKWAGRTGTGPARA